MPKKRLLHITFCCRSIDPSFVYPFIQPHRAEYFLTSVYDSYTRQAQVWWQGRADLSENIPWLELAEYNGRIFVSFPPFPSVVQFLLYPFLACRCRTIS